MSFIRACFPVSGKKRLHRELIGGIVKMSIVVLDGSTIRSFVKDEEAFHRSIDGWFQRLDTNRDGLLFYPEFVQLLQKMNWVVEPSGCNEGGEGEGGGSGLCDSVFRAFDHDSSGAIDLGEFRAEMKKVMLGMAEGLGSLPVQMLLEDDDSLLKQAADLESSSE
ncbi:hypothetical protein EJ110_NYTH56953 [Nymphaea thermarum]|nr:hypothetical protein EJ110_NYTH56953 [Nymphaea thermarum]